MQTRGSQNSEQGLTMKQLQAGMKLGMDNTG